MRLRVELYIVLANIGYLAKCVFVSSCFPTVGGWLDVFVFPIAFILVA